MHGLAPSGPTRCGDCPDGAIKADLGAMLPGSWRVRAVETDRISNIRDPSVGLLKVGGRSSGQVLDAQGTFAPSDEAILKSCLFQSRGIVGLSIPKFLMLDISGPSEACSTFPRWSQLDGTQIRPAYPTLPRVTICEMHILDKDHRSFRRHAGPVSPAGLRLS
jgi:hypothetical protein